VEHTRGNVIRPGQVMTVVGEGFPKHRAIFNKGDLHITFTIVTDLPARFLKTDESHAATLRDLLPRHTHHHTHVRAPKNPELSEDVFLEEIDPSRRAGGHQRQAYDDDDEDEDSRGRSGPAAQCAQQ
jgi:DnaJ-class molecular chaperone